MIELFDAQRLLERRDHSLAIAGGVLAIGIAGLSVHAFMLHSELQLLQAEDRKQHAELARFKGQAASPTPALLADLEQLALRLEAEVAATGGGSSGVSPKPSQWLARLDSLASPDIGLSVVEIDRAGSARVEGVAKTPQAMSSYVQSWEREQAPAPMRARAIEVRQDDKGAPFLRFQMRANLPPPSQASSLHDVSLQKPAAGSKK